MDVEQIAQVTLKSRALRQPDGDFVFHELCLALVVKSGKYSLKYKSALKWMRNCKVVANFPQLFPRALEHEAEKVP